MGYCLDELARRKAPAKKGPAALLEGVERRVDQERRKRIEAMTREQLIRELYTDDLTGLPNRRAYEEAEPKACQAVLNVDGLKWLNDHLSHLAGDALIRAVATVLTDTGVEAYRVAGDEFVCQFEMVAEAHEKLATIAHRLEHAMFSFPDAHGRVRWWQGIGLSYGLGSSRNEAEDGLRMAKIHREQKGLRAARGERPPYMTEIEPGCATEVDQPILTRLCSEKRLPL